MRWDVRHRLSCGLVRLAVLLLFVGIGLSFRLSTKPVESAIMTGTGNHSPAENEICANLVLSWTEGGGDAVSAERVFTRRMRRGPFFLAAREMVVQNLAMTLPDAYFVPPPTASAAKADGSGGMSQLIETLSGGGGRVRDLMPTVAGFVVRGLRLARLEGGTNAVPWLQAPFGRAERGGLSLREATVIESGRTNVMSGAFLEFTPCVRLR